MSDSTSRVALPKAGLRVAAIVPCHNEEVTIGKVVRDLRESVPGIDVYVYDNCSTDHTAVVARAAGAIVRSESCKGKGNVVRRAFADVDADIYVLIDGDDTYDATAAPSMISALLAGPYDHVLGVRRPVDEAAYRSGHQRGNQMLNKVVEVIFGDNVGDMLSGFRVFSRRFVKSFPAFSSGFEIETELTIHTLSTRVPQTSVPVAFRERPAGSESKLHTYSDGLRILQLILSLARHERPMAFYGVLSATFAVVGLAAILPWLVAGRFDVGLGIVSGLATTLAITLLVAGGITESMRRSRHTHARLNYLAHAPVSALPGSPADRTVFELGDVRGLGSSRWLANLSEQEAV